MAWNYFFLYAVLFPNILTYLLWLACINDLWRKWFWELFFKMFLSKFPYGICINIQYSCNLKPFLNNFCLLSFNLNNYSHSHWHPEKLKWLSIIFKLTELKTLKPQWIFKLFTFVFSDSSQKWQKLRCYAQVSVFLYWNLHRKQNILSWIHVIKKENNGNFGRNLNCIHF